MYPDMPSGFGLVRLQWTGVDGTGHAESVIGFSNVAADDAPTIAAEVDAAYTHVPGPISFMSDQAFYSGCQVVLNTGGVYTEAQTTTSVAGGAAGNLHPPNSAMLIRKQTALHGRHYRGRIYQPYLTDTLTDTGGGMINPGTLSGADTAWNNFLNALSAEGVELVLLHRDLTIPPTIITALTVEQTVATQRRRLRKAAHR